MTTNQVCNGNCDQGRRCDCVTDYVLYPKELPNVDNSELARVWNVVFEKAEHDHV